MKNACQRLHKIFNNGPRFGHDQIEQLPTNGIYVLFESGERSHGLDRIVRIGTHTGDDNLQIRLREHLFTPNKDRSIFRKHVGRCLLSQASDPLLEQWEIDLTTKAMRAENAPRIDHERIRDFESQVTNYMHAKFSFTAIHVATKSQRLRLEEAILSTLFLCEECAPSSDWLGRQHPNPILRDSGLWNIQGLRGTPLNQDELNILERLL